MAGLNEFPGFISDFVRGQTKDFVIEITKNDAPVNITGAKFLIIFKKTFDPQAAIFLQKTIDPPTDPVAGKTDGQLTDDETLSFEPGTYYYTVKYINALGSNYPIDMGKLDVQQCLDETIA